MALYMIGLPDDLLRTVGAITVAFAQLEESLTDLIAVAVSPSPTNREPTMALVHHDSFGAKLKKLRVLSSTQGRLGDRSVYWTLTDYAPDELLTKIRRFADELERVSKRRNDIVHSSWWHRQVEGVPEATRRAASYRARPVRVREVWTAADFDDALRDVKDALMASGALFGELYEAARAAGKVPS